MADTDNELIDSCSPATAEGYRTLTRYISGLSPTAIDGVAYYALNFVDYNGIREFLQSDIRIRKQNAENTLLVQDNANRLWYLFKLFQEFNIDGWRNYDFVQDFLSAIERQQTKEGRFPGYIDTVDKLRVLALVKPEDPITADAEQYCRNNWEQLITNSKKTATVSSLLILAFSEIDFDRYRDQMSDIAKHLKGYQSEEGYFGELRDDPAAPNAPRYLPIEETSLAVSALNRIGNHEQEIDSAVGWLLEEQRDNGGWKQNEAAHHRDIRHFTISTAFALHALVNTRKGPLVSRGQAEWEIELRKQERNKVRPEFVETFPTPELETRKREIDEQIASMIRSAEDRIRISSLQIDKHHDALIDAIDEDVHVQVLSRMESPRGERKKMKRAVLNDLIKHSEGQVRGDNLNHSRLVIVDNRELLVPSADLTRDQLVDEFNAGLYTRDQEAVQDAIGFFDKLWEEAEPLDVN